MLKLVYACLAFSLVAGAIIFVSAVEQGRSFRGMTKTMGDAIANGATVLDADRNGAITQTGNGRVKGFNRDGNSQWETKVDRFAEGPSNPYGAGSNDASAWCTPSCPSAILEFETEFESHGAADAQLAKALDYIRPKPVDVLAFAGTSTVFLRQAAEGSSAPQLVVVDPTKSVPTPGVVNPSEIQPKRARDRVFSGSAVGKVGSLKQIVEKDGRWSVVGRSVSEAGLKNVCVSDDDAWVGAVSTRISRFAAGGQPRAALGPAITSGTCTVDQQGITAIYTAAADPNRLQAARYSAGGRRIWQHDFGAQRLLSPAGSPYVVAQAPDGTVNALDAVTGRTVLKQRILGQPFVGFDGSIVTANRQGEPQWLREGKAPAS